jgi:hypothetical protein
MSDPSPLASGSLHHAGSGASSTGPVVIQSSAGAGSSQVEILRTEMGQVGKLIGGPQHSVNNAAFVILIILCIILAVALFVPSVKDTNVTTALLSAITGGLGFIFGRSNRSP